MKRHGPGLAFAINFHIHTSGQGIHHRCPHPMETTRGGVGACSEFSPGMQFGEHQFHTGQPSARLDINGNTTSRVRYFHAVIRVKSDRNVVTVPGNGLVNRVIDKFP